MILFAFPFYSVPLEFSGQSGKIQVSESTYQLLSSAFSFEKIANMDIKGKGKGKGKGKINVFVWSPTLQL